MVLIPVLTLFTMHDAVQEFQRHVGQRIRALESTSRRISEGREIPVVEDADELATNVAVHKVAQAQVAVLDSALLPCKVDSWDLPSAGKHKKGYGRTINDVEEYA